jgi:hypothetical protein
MARVERVQGFAAMQTRREDELDTGVLQGTPLTTADIDVVHRRSKENVERLLVALGKLDAVARGDRRRLRPAASHLLGAGQILLDTRLGRLDCLCTIDGGRGYDELLPRSLPLELGEGLRVRVLEIEELVEIKRRAGRPKDLAVIPCLEATLDELRRR